ALLQTPIAHRNERLHPTVEIEWHEVGGAEQVLRRRRVGPEAIHARMLEEPSDARAHSDGVGESGDLRTEAADPAHDEIDRYPSLRRRVQRVDHAWIDERVHLHGDATVGTLRRFAFDSFADGLPRMRR